MWLSCRTLENNNITGGLSSTWGAPGVFQSLVEMDLSQNWNLNGILLSQWGGPGAFPRLQVSWPEARCLLEEAICFPALDQSS